MELAAIFALRQFAILLTRALAPAKSSGSKMTNATSQYLAA